MKVKWAGYKGDRLVVMADAGLKTLGICRDVPCPHAFILDDRKDKAVRLGARVYETDLREHLGKRRVARYEVASPRMVADIRDRAGYRITFEADIPYIRRLFVDRVLEPDWSNPFVWLDIEVDDSHGFPKPEKDKVVSIAFSLDGSRVDFIHADDFGGEKEMLEWFKQKLIREGKSIAVGWNVDFDLGFLRKRGRMEFLSGFDLMEEYKGAVKGLEHYSLDYVAKREGLGGKPTTKRIHEMTRAELEEYNRNDVAMMLEIDRKYGFTKIRAKLGELVGLLNDDLAPVRIGDTLILRRARELGFVLSNAVNDKKKGYQGAVVLEPVKRGLIRNVAVLDYESLYPNVIVNEKIDIPGFNGEVLPHIEAEILKLRKQAKKRFKETGDVKYDIEQQALKILANTLYGLFGAEGFRFFNESTASKITAKGREMLMLAKDAIEAMGYLVVYGDSVAGDAQIYYITLGGVPRVVTIEELFNHYKQYARVRPDGKEEAYVKHLRMLTPSIDTRTGSVGLGEIVRIIRHKVSKPMCEVVTETGKRVKATVDHSLIAYDKVAGAYVEVSCLDLEPKRHLMVALNEAGNGARFERVVEIRPVDAWAGYVYDLEVEGYHTFLANGLFVHNTDSVFVTGWTSEGELESLVASVNAVVSPYAMKLEYVGDLYIMAKKRYILRARDGREIAKGVELVRSDWAPLFKTVVRDVIDMLFQGKGRKEVKEYLAKLKMKLWKGELDRKLIICKGLSAKEYKVDAEHVRAGRKWSAVTNTPLESLTRVCYYYVNTRDGVEPVDPLNPSFPKKPHYQRYWDRVMALVERLVIT